MREQNYLEQSSQCFLPLETPEDWLEKNGLKFTDAEVRNLREAVLKDALQNALDGRCSAKTRKENYDWIMSDAVAPFSFVVCAKTCGQRPEELREAFKRLYQKLQSPASAPQKQRRMLRKQADWEQELERLKIMEGEYEI